MSDTVDVIIRAQWKGAGQVSSARKALNSLGTSSTALGTKFDKLGDKATRLDQKLNRVGDGAAPAMKQAGQATDQLGKQLDSGAKSASGFGTAASKAGALVGGAVVAGIAAGGAAVGAFAASSVQASLEFESAFAGVVKTIDGLTDEFGNLNEEGEAIRQQFRDLGKEIPVSVNALAGIGELGGQLGIAKADIIDFTETIAKVSVATNLTEEAAATSFAQIANVMGSTQDDVERFASAVVDLGNNSATTESQIVNFASRIAGAGAIAGLSEADIAAIAASFSSVGVEAEAGGTAVQESLIKINDAVASGNEQLFIFASTAGMSVDDFKTLWEQDAAGAFTRFVEGLGRQGDMASATLDAVGLGGARSTRAFLSLANAGPLLADSIQLANDAFEENNALNKEAEQRFKTRESQIQLLSNKFDDLKISVGDRLAPAIDILIERTDKLLDSFAAFAETEEFEQFVDRMTSGIAYWTGQMKDQTSDMIDNNLALAESTEDVEREFAKLLTISDELDTIDPFANTLTQESTADVVRRVAEVSTSVEEFERTIGRLNQAAIESGNVGSFNVYDVLGSEQEWASYYNTIQDEAEAARKEVEALAIASASNNFDLSDRELSGTSYGDTRGYQLLAEDLAAVAEKAPLTAEELEKLAKTRIKWELDAFGQAGKIYGELEDALIDLEEAQGEYVTRTVDYNKEISDVNAQLASDLNNEQKKAYEKILDTVDEGSTEWLNAYNALQNDLTDSTRAGLIARRAELEGMEPGMITVYTGDAEAAEEAQARIEQANAAIVTSYRETVFEALLAQTGVTESTLALGVQLGLLTQEQADARFEFSQTTAALQELATSDTFGAATLNDQVEAVNLLTLGYADTADEAFSLAQEIDGNLASSVRNATTLTDELATALDGISGTTTSTVDIVVNGLDALREAELLRTGSKTITSPTSGEELVTFADGGYMPAGGPYLVGEEGPELVVPARDGYVMTADQTRQILGNGGGATLSVGQIVIQTGGDGDPQAIRTAVMQALEEQSNRLGSLVRAGGAWGA